MLMTTDTPLLFSVIPLVFFLVFYDDYSTDPLG